MSLDFIVIIGVSLVVSFVWPALMWEHLKEWAPLRWLASLLLVALWLATWMMVERSKSIASAQTAPRTPAQCCMGPRGELPRQLGYDKLITYTRPEEGGASLRASGFLLSAEVPAESWDRPARPRTDKSLVTKKIRWEIRL